MGSELRSTVAAGAEVVRALAERVDAAGAFLVRATVISDDALSVTYSTQGGRIGATRDLPKHFKTPELMAPGADAIPAEASRLVVLIEQGMVDQPTG